MNFFRTILILGTLTLLVVIFILLRVTNQAVDSGTEPNRDPNQVNFPDSQEITPIEPVDKEKPVVREFGEAPEEYSVQPIPTSGLVTSVARQDYSNEFSNVVGTLFVDQYFLDQCIGPAETERALILTAKPNQSLGEDQFRATEQAILDWETHIPSDIGNILNPSQALSDLAQVEAAFTSYDLYTRYTTYTLGNETHQIYYSWVLNFIVFAPSFECLTASVNNLYSPWSH